MPEDAKLIIIMAPKKDLYDQEYTVLESYINNGGNLFVTTGLTQSDIGFTNLQAILEFYGVNYNYGYVAETNSNYAHDSSKVLTFPVLNEEHPITADIASEKLSLVFPTAGKITVKSEAELAAIKTTVTNILTSSKTATFTNDAVSSVDTAVENGEKGEYIEGVCAERIVEENTTNVFDTSSNIVSKLVYIANDLFMTDYIISDISSDYPLSYLDGNRDLALNSISYLNGRTDTISVRKSVGTATFSTTDFQSTQVLVFIFALPVVIIISGISVYRNRKRRV